MFYFLIKNSGNDDPDWIHYFFVKAPRFEIPQSAGWWAKHVIAVTNNLLTVEALKKMYTNSHMRAYLEGGNQWPVIEGWRLD